MEDKILSESESMQLITSMINKAQNRFNENGTIYLLWGWAILTCCVIQFIALYFFKNQNPYYIWFLTWPGVIYQIIYSRQRKKKQRTKTYTDEIVEFIWMVFIACIALLVFMQLHLKSVATIYPSILIMYGMPTILSGLILKSNALKIGGICCWMLAILSVFIFYEFQLLLIAIAVIIAWIIPGYLLKSKFKKRN